MNRAILPRSTAFCSDGVLTVEGLLGGGDPPLHQTTEDTVNTEALNKED